MTVLLRSYRASDARATADVYRAAIRTTAARHYDHAQVTAWLGGDIDLERWNRNRATAWTVVAELNGAVVGFSDLTTDAQLDMLFVHPDAGGQGVARQLVMAVLAHARRRELARVTTHASRAARPVLERLGFVADAENPTNMVRGVAVPNVDMHIDL